MSDQGNQGVQQKVDDMARNQDGLVGDIKSKFKDEISNKKEELSKKVKNIEQDLQAEDEIQALLKKIKDQ